MNDRLINDRFEGDSVVSTRIGRDKRRPPRPRSNRSLKRRRESTNFRFIGMRLILDLDAASLERFGIEESIEYDS
jgi:hypothetical protein